MTEEILDILKSAHLRRGVCVGHVFPLPASLNWDRVWGQNRPTSSVIPNQSKSNRIKATMTAVLRKSESNTENQYFPSPSSVNHCLWSVSYKRIANFSLCSCEMRVCICCCMSENFSSPNAAKTNSNMLVRKNVQFFRHALKKQIQ